MPPGKLAAQAGHAYLGAFLAAQNINPTVACEYAADAPGTKVCLSAPLETLYEIHERARAQGLPTALITDSGHVLPPHFTGEPIVTAVGLGPATRDQVKKLLKKTRLT